MFVRTLFTAAWLGGVAGLLLLAACTQSAKEGGDRAAARAPSPGARQPGGGEAGAIAERPPTPSGPAIEVTWEALSRERYLLENSRYKRRGPTPPQKITLLSTSHPDAARAKVPRTQEDRARYVNTAVLRDRDMLDLLRGLERNGFYRYARPGRGGADLLRNENARGRVTVDRDGTTRTLVSLRGQGLDANSKEIPRIYSETKQAVMVLRNMTPTLNVQHFGADPLRR